MLKKSKTTLTDIADKSGKSSRKGPMKPIVGFIPTKDLRSLALSNKQFQVIAANEAKSRAYRVVAMRAGESHDVLLLSSAFEGHNKVFVRGGNDYQYIGLKKLGYYHEFNEVALPKGFSLKDVFAGPNQTFFLGKESGNQSLLVCGHNQSGELGIGKISHNEYMARVNLPSGFELNRVITSLKYSVFKGKDIKSGVDQLYVCGAIRENEVFENQTEFTKLPNIEIPENFELEDVVVARSFFYLLGKNIISQEVMLFESDRALSIKGLMSTSVKTVKLFPNFNLQKVVVADSYASTSIFLLGQSDTGSSLYVFGSNNVGQLGLGSDADVTMFQDVDLPPKFIVDDVCCHSTITVLKGNNTVTGKDQLYACGNFMPGMVAHMLEYFPSMIYEKKLDQDGNLQLYSPGSNTFKWVKLTEKIEKIKKVLCRAGRILLEDQDNKLYSLDRGQIIELQWPQWLHLKNDGKKPAPR
ncbi:MAG TPA: hypothetical protein QF353_02655 [Gammaproteobacteria bacterium]|nr:hypothetical protein [Gammaproteobacteria bacterium]